MERMGRHPGWVLLAARQSTRNRRRKMKRAIAVFLLTTAVLTFTVAHPVQAQTNTTQVTLSCNDGHSVIFDVNQTELTSLLADVQAINASGTGNTCTLTMAAIDPSSETTKWTVYDYNPSNQAIAPRNSPNSMPATTWAPQLRSHSRPVSTPRYSPRPTRA